MSESISNPLGSLANPRVKGVVKLRRRSERDERGRMVIDGCRELGRALDNGHRIRELYCCRGLFHGRDEESIVQRCREAGADVFECTEPVFRKMAYGDRADGLLAVAPLVSVGLASLELPHPALVVVAEAIEKPGNLGAILRSADAAGVHAAIVCDRCTDVSNPNVIRASTGTVFALPVVECTTEEAQVWLRQQGFQMVASSPHTERLLTEVDLTGDIAIVVGREDTGLSPAWLENADVRVRIPMFGQADSLNAAASTTILLYEAVRQRITERYSK